jgi:hypothetical protein
MGYIKPIGFTIFLLIIEIIVVEAHVLKDKASSGKNIRFYIPR